jgi:TBC1 domain family member 8/9
MATISTALRNFKEPTKDQLTQIFFSIPPDPTAKSKSKFKKGDDQTHDGSELAAEKMDINAVLSLGTHGHEDSYVSIVVLLPVCDNENDDHDDNDDYRQENYT